MADDLKSIDHWIDAKMNLEVAILLDHNNDAYFFFRARPWKNKSNNGQMVIAAAYEMYDCLDKLAELHLAGKWILLDWALRITPDYTDSQINALRNPVTGPDPTPSRRRRSKTSADGD